MRAGVVVCMLAMLLCHETLCTGVPKVGGLCKSVNDLPLAYRTECKYVDCHKDINGKTAYSEIDCPLDSVYDPGNDCKIEQNRQATYPDCCDRIVCTKA